MSQACMVGFPYVVFSGMPSQAEAIHVKHFHSIEGEVHK